MKAAIDSLKEEVLNDKCLIVNLPNRVPKSEKDNAQKDGKDLEKVDMEACDRLDQSEKNHLN